MSLLDLIGSPKRMAGPLLVGALLSVATLAGCGSSPEARELRSSGEAQGLAGLGRMYRVASDELGRPPKTIEELRKAEARVPGGLSGIGVENVAIYFGAELPAAAGTPGDGASETILAYDRMVPRQGGFVLMLDQSVRKMSAGEFKSAKKAGKTAWVAPKE